MVRIDVNGVVMTGFQTELATCRVIIDKKSRLWSMFRFKHIDKWASTG